MLIVVPGLIIISCKSELKYSKASFTRMPEVRKIAYQITYPLKNSGKLLAIIPDDPDTNSHYFSSIAKELSATGYDVIVIGKPGEDTYKKRSLDSREERIEDVVTLLTASDSLYRKELIILGAGQGAYILPALEPRLQPGALVFVNAGVLSPLAELEYITNSDSLSGGNESLLNYYGIDDRDMLSSKIENIKNEAFGSMQLAPASNRCWMSYYQSPLINQLALLQLPVLWYNYEDYPLISIPGSELTEKILDNYPNIRYAKSKEVNNGVHSLEQDLESLFNKH